MHHYRHSQNIPSRFASNTRIRAEEFRRQPLTLMKTYKLGCLLLVAVALMSGDADERFLERNGFARRDICLHLLLLFLATSLTAAENDWKTGFTGDIPSTNTGTAPITQWSLA